MMYWLQIVGKKGMHNASFFTCGGVCREIGSFAARIPRGKQGKYSLPDDGEELEWIKINLP